MKQIHRSDFLVLNCLKLIIFKVKIPQSSLSCNPAEVLTLQPDAQQWLCDKPFNSTAVPENTRCFLKCNYGFAVFQGEFNITSASYYMIHNILRHKICNYMSTILSEGKRAFHRCGADGEWHRPDKVSQLCLPKCEE